VVEVVFATVDHSDIRGSKPHNRDPSGAASDYKRGFGPKTYRIELFEDSPFRVPLDHYPRCLLCASDFRTNSLQAARCRRSFCAVSTFIPMAQIKPNNSRPIAVTTTPLFFPLASNFL
jgi:hypothetical protein